MIILPCFDDDVVLLIRIGNALYARFAFLDLMTGTTSHSVVFLIIDEVALAEEFRTEQQVQNEIDNLKNEQNEHDVTSHVRLETLVEERIEAGENFNVLIFVFLIIDVEFEDWIAVLFDDIALACDISRRVVEADRSTSIAAECEVRKI